MSDPAVARWGTIQAVRLSGMAALIYAMLAANGNAPWPGGVPRVAATGVALLAAAVMLAGPVLLARRWRSRPVDDQAGDQG